MYSLHITEQALTDICADKYNNWNFIAKEQNTILVDNEKGNEIFIDEENVVFIFSQMYDVEFKSDPDLFNKIYANPADVLISPCGAYILNIDKIAAKKIESDYGVICQSVHAINDDILSYYQPVDCICNKTNHNWKSILGDITNHVTNSIIINDRYLFIKDYYDSNSSRNNTIGIDNCVKIIDSILPNKYADEYHILIAFERKGTADEMPFNKIVNILNKQIKRLRNYSIVLEVLSYNNNCYNY